MTDFNRTILAGNLTRDPELRYTPSGMPVCSFSIAVNSTFTDKKGQKNEQVLFVPIIVWGKQGENTAEYMKKGRGVLIEGKLKQEKWNSKEGEKRSRLVVTANLVRFLPQSAKAQQGKPPINPSEPNTPAQDQPEETEEHIPF